jgi:hypothetical protein
MAAVQREEETAQWRRRNGIAREEQVFRDDRFRPHPSVGGSRGYDITLRRMLIDDYTHNRGVPTRMIRSIQRWINRLYPYRMTGNRPNRELSGEYLLLLVIYKLFWHS